VSQVFISYDRESRDLAEAIAEDIQALGPVVWLDRELTGGQPWWERILAQIRACDVFVYVLTQRSLDSVACQREHGYAAALGKTVLPVLTDAGVSTNLLPPALAQLQFVDYRSPDRAAALRLGRAFGAVPQQAVALPNPLPDTPKVPISYLGSLADRLSATRILNQEEQSVLLLDLKAHLRDPESAEDARSLIRQFRRRPELLASIAFEIDEVLAPSDAPSLRQGRGEENAPPTIQIEAKAHSVASPKPIRDEIIDRLPPGLAGALLGFVIGALTLFSVGGFTHDDLVYALAPCLGGAVAGVMAGRRWKVVLGALGGAVMGWIVVFIFLVYLDTHSPFLFGRFFARAVIDGAPIGAILGAIAALIYLELTRKR